MTEQEFWEWFVDFKSQVEPHFHPVNPKKLQSLYEQMCEVMNRYHPKIACEIAGGENKFEITITALGVKKYMPYVEKLVAAAPEIENWTILKYRQTGDYHNLDLGGLALDEKDIKVSAHKVPRSDQYSICVYMKGYDKDDSRYEQAAFIYLDHVIGEYNMLTRVQYKGCKKLDMLASTMKLYSLKQLGELFK